MQVLMYVGIVPGKEYSPDRIIKFRSVDGEIPPEDLIGKTFKFTSAVTKSDYMLEIIEEHE